ncbi:hypothetical protein SDC9_136816 [bioreactor metagenome]|uniref:Uncharacterized protein n=1 Tax=bioreactor metagenome TaxID=1076179 RepID=A0A645DJT4_9ZZZZ
MNNQLYLWGSVILPWFTLLFLKADDVKRYMPVALFGALVTTIIGEIALALNWWSIKESIFPFYHLAPYIYGAFPVGVIWIFKFTHDRFWLFILANAALDIILAFPILNFTIQRGIVEIINITSFQLFLVFLLNAVALYVYQEWQDDAPLFAESTKSSPNLQTALAKPLPEDKDDQE